MIKPFIALKYDPIILNTLEVRATQLVRKFLDFSKDESFKNSIYRRHYVAGKESSPTSPSKRTLEAILFHLRKERKLTAAQAEAFLCLLPDGKLADWQALILSLSLEHRRLFGEKERSLRAMSSFRFLLQDKQKNKNAYIVAAIEGSLPNPSLRLDQIEKSLTHYLNSLDDLPKKQKAYITQRLLPLRRLVADVSEEEQKHLRKRTRSNEGKSKKIKPVVKRPEVKQPEAKQPVVKRPEVKQPEAKQPEIPQEPIKEGNFSTLSQRARVDDGEVNHTQVHEYSDKTNETIDDLEFKHDNAPERSYITLVPETDTPPSLKRSFMLSAIRAKKVASHLERNEKKPVTMINQLTRHDVTSLIEALQAHPPSHPEVMLVLHLMLTTGRRLEQVLQAKVIKHSSELNEPGDAIVFHDNGEFFWMYRPDLPKHELAGPLDSLVHQPKSPVILPLPFFPSTSGATELPEPSKELRQAVTEYLNDLNGLHKTKLTANRIADFLSSHLHRHGVDDVLSALITGNPSIQEAGTYYYQYDHETIIRNYQLFTNEFFSNYLPEVIEKNLINLEGGGSQLFVKQKAVTALFAHLSVKVDSSKGIAEYHNAYTYYVLHLLNLATGHRPVRDPFDDLDHVDLINKKIFISDKESRQTASSARTLVLPEIAVRQLKLYVKHLENIQILLHSLGPQLAEEVEMTLAGKNRLLFLLIEKEHGGYETKPLSPSGVKNYLGSLFDIPTNWHRHFLRTSLARHGVPGEIIDSWMGHAKIGQEGYSRYSGLSMQGLESTAEIIDQIIETLEVKPLPGWGEATNHE
ncbi:MAG TPA: hypothetical protein VK099_06340 [Alcanivoracaceae bacterium]|nr:hypothetical protein [Alcanivoracaceae bacterium]